MKKVILFSLFFLFALFHAYSFQLIGVTAPAYCSEIEGDTIIHILAPGCTEVTVSCWKQGDGFGSNAVVGTVSLDENGVGSILFPADEYPHGPITIKISGTINVQGVALVPDNCYLQLYNKGGVSWNEGLPPDPPAAEGMTLLFADDFDGELSIGSSSSKYTYYDHKPPFGNTDFSSPLKFTSASNANNPFSQVDTYLRIRGDEAKKSTGIISSLFSNNKGIMASAPCYFECRFIGPNAPGSWPAFWLLSVKDMIGDNNEPCDELDIIEAYGGEGSGRPNAGAAYQVAAHPWGRTSELTNIDVIEGKRVYGENPVKMPNFGIPSAWYETSHIYGCKIEKDYTTYYCDNIEVQKHLTFEYSKTKPLFFLINLATGGGWETDLSRYDGLIDMYVDYVRVYSGAPSGITSPEKSDFDVIVSPNPVNDESTIYLNSPELENIAINLYDALGQQVFSHKICQQGNVEIPIDMSDMNAGIYFAKINVGDSSVGKTVIKK